MRLIQDEHLLRAAAELLSIVEAGICQQLVESDVL